MENQTGPGVVAYLKGVAAAGFLLALPIVLLLLVDTASLQAGGMMWTPRFGRMQANTYTTDLQIEARIGATFDGRFTIAWNSGSFGGGGQDGSGFGVSARWFNPVGMPLGTEFQVNSYTTGDQLVGDVVETFYQSKYSLGVSYDSFGQDGDNFGVYLRLYTDGIADDANALQVNLTTTGIQNGSDLFMSEDTAPPFQLSGGVVFESFLPGSGANVRFRGGTYSGNQTGPYPSSVSPRQIGGQEFQINTYTTGYQGRPSACGHTDGDFVVAWVSFGQDPSGASIFGRLGQVDTGGVGSEFQVNTNTLATQDYPEVCCSDNGFVVAWQNGGYPVSVDGDGGSVSARRFDAAAQPLGTEFVVNEFTTGTQQSARIACDSAGNFVVAWRTVTGPNVGAHARAFAADGTPFGGDHQLSPTSSKPDVALADDGAVIAVWEDSFPGGDQVDIAYQAFSVPGLGVTTTTLPPADVCGDPVDPQGGGGLTRAVTATDALFALQAAVGAGACPDCLCDVNGAGGVTATDALIILQVAVGQQIPLNCPACT